MADKSVNPTQLSTTTIHIGRLAVPEDELDILAVVHRMPGVEQVWMQVDDLVVVHDPQQVTRHDMLNAVIHRGFRVREV
jgi:hypothetical protein